MFIPCIKGFCLYKVLISSRALYVVGAFISAQREAFSLTANAETGSMFSFIIFSIARVDNPQFKLISLKGISAACFSKKIFSPLALFFYWSCVLLKNSLYFQYNRYIFLLS